MPVIADGSFTFQTLLSKKDAAGNVIDIVHAGGTERYEIQLTAVLWQGQPVSADIPLAVYYSDGRAFENKILAKDVPLVIAVSAAVARIVEVTLVDKTPNSDYFIKIPLQFS